MHWVYNMCIQSSTDPPSKILVIRQHPVSQHIADAKCRDSRNVSHTLVCIVARTTRVHAVTGSAVTVRERSQPDEQGHTGPVSVYAATLTRRDAAAAAGRRWPSPAAGALSGRSRRALSTCGPARMPRTSMRSPQLALMYDNRQLTHNSQQQIDTNETQIGGRGTAFSSAACPNYLGCSRPSWGDLNDDSGWYQLEVDDLHICDTCQEEAIPVGDEGHVRSRRLLG